MSLLISLTAFKNKKIVLLTHVGADTDAIAAAGALSLFLGKKNSVKVAVPEHISLNAKHLAKKMGINFAINPSLANADTLIIVDLNSWDMLGKMASAVKEFSGSVFLVDHHSKSTDKIAPAKNTWIEENSIASCMLVFEWAKQSNVVIGKKAAMLLALGITADSAHFLTADAKAFEAMAELLQKSGKRFSQLTGLLSIERHFSEKIAMLKAAKRSRTFKIGDFIVVVSDVGAFEADAATALIKLGADLAFVGDSSNNELRISGRASQQILDKTKIDLAKDVFQPLGKFFSGSGGGHSGAAAFNGKGNNVQEALMECVSLAKKKILASNPKATLKEYT